MSNRVRIIALFVAKDDQIENLKTLLTGLIAPTRNEKGCLEYALHQNKQNPADFVFVEEWEDDSAIDRHMESAHIRAALPRVGDFLTAPPDIRRYRLIA